MSRFHYVLRNPWGFAGNKLRLFNLIDQFEIEWPFDKCLFRVKSSSLLFTKLFRVMTSFILCPGYFWGKKKRSFFRQGLGPIKIKHGVRTDIYSINRLARYDSSPTAQYTSLKQRRFMMGWQKTLTRNSETMLLSTTVLKVKFKTFFKTWRYGVQWSWSRPYDDVHKLDVGAKIKDHWS